MNGLPSAANPLRLAIVGTEHPHSRSFQETLTQLPGSHICTLLDDGGSILPSLQHLPRHHDLQTLLEREAFDAAIVTVSPDRATEILVRLAEAGKHMLCDKPVCRNADEMQRVVEAVERHGVRFATAYTNRFRPVQERAKDLIRKGRLGTIFALQASLFTTSVASRGAGRSEFVKARFGGGILSWESCHFIDMLLDITERPVAGARGLIATLGGDAIDVEDVGSLTIQFEGGAVANLTAGYTMPRNIDDPARFSQKDTALSVWGSRAKLELEPFGTQLQLVDYRAAGEQPVRQVHTLPYPMTPGSYTGALGLYMMEDFVASIAAGRPPRADETAALRVLEVLDAVYESAAPVRDERRAMTRIQLAPPEPRSPTIRGRNRCD